MAYSELIKDFERIRDYMREFYVYGFKSRLEFHQKSSRSYDNEKRRIESYLADYIAFRQTPGGKNMFLPIDSRATVHNPLYKALKAKSFTNRDITLHFILLDILYNPEVKLTVMEITKEIDTQYLSHFEKSMVFDESTVRKKLNEYRELGIIAVKKQGNKLYYSRAGSIGISQWREALSFFSEAGMNGVIGSFLLDRMEGGKDYFSFKHHDITQALESEVLYNLFQAISKHREVTIKNISRHAKEVKTWDVVPLRIFVSAQNGRRYLVGYNKRMCAIKSYRLDYITEIKVKEVSSQFEQWRTVLDEMQKHMWGVTCKKNLSSLEHVEFSVYIGKGENYIYDRMEREKRCGTVEMVDEHTCRFTAELYDTSEIIPWIRTFIGRIISMNFSNRTIENQFKKDIVEMYELYKAEGE